MSRIRTFLICSNELHAEFVDQLVFARLQDEEGAFGSCWSGVYTDGTRYGILWAAPVSTLFGVPEDFPELQLAEEAEPGEWFLVEPATEVVPLEEPAATPSEPTPTPEPAPLPPG